MLFFNSEFDDKVDHLAEMAQKMAAYRGGMGASPSGEFGKTVFVSALSRGLGNAAARAIGVPELENPIQLASSVVPTVMGFRNVYNNVQGADFILREQLDSGQITPEEYAAAVERLRKDRNSRLIKSAIGSGIGTVVGKVFSRRYPRVYVPSVYF